MQTITIRASSLPDLFDCPARWEARNIRKLFMPSSPAATIGRAVHAGAAAFDQSRLDGSPITTDDAAGAVVDCIHHPEEEIDWREEKPEEAERISLALHVLYCDQIAQKQNYAAIEATCDSLNITDLGISLTGTTDRVRRDESGQLGIADIKTGKAAVAADGTVKTAGHAAQLAVYELLASHAIGERMEAPAQIIGLQVAKTDKGRRAGIGTVTGAMELLLGDEDSPGMLEYASRMIKSGDFYGNPRSQICNEKYCPVYDRCRWRK